MNETLARLLPENALRAWSQITAAVDALYEMDTTWGRGFGEWECEYKYRRGGKTLCTLYAKAGAAELLITYGKAEREKFEAVKASVSPAIQAIYDATDTLHDGKWLWLPMDETLDVADVVTMLKIKRKPNRKPLPA